jgi:carbamoyl-phosphate synthase small subunit
VNHEDDQSCRPWVAGLVVKDAPSSYSSWRADASLQDYLVKHGVVAIDEVDTRRLTRHIRARGAMRAALSSDGLTADEVVDVARAAPAYDGRDLVDEVTCREPYTWPSTRPEKRVAALDFGIKRNLLERLAASGFEVSVLPARTSAEKILPGGFDALFLSNGPGDPAPLGYAADTVRAVLGRLPVLGICLGHQILAHALGAKTFKLRFGHRAANHPVKRTSDGRIEITSQNHGFAVAAESLTGTGATVSHHNLNDGTVEGIELAGLARGVQYHPEAGPGPHDARPLFDGFGALMHSFEPREPATAGSV